jgi:hypothetical protein
MEISMKAICILSFVLLTTVGCTSDKTSTATARPNLTPANPGTVEAVQTPPRQQRLRLEDIAVQPLFKEVDVIEIGEGFRKFVGDWRSSWW